MDIMVKFLGLNVDLFEKYSSTLSVLLNELGFDVKASVEQSSLSSVNSVLQLLILCSMSYNSLSTGKLYLVLLAKEV